MFHAESTSWSANNNKNCSLVETWNSTDKIQPQQHLCEWRETSLLTGQASLYPHKSDAEPKFKFFTANPLLNLQDLTAYITDFNQNTFACHTSN